MKKPINVLDYAEKFNKDIQKGFLLTTKADDQVNTMVIGWGTIGIEWAKPICTVFVRTSRKTHENIEKNPEFTVNIPIDRLDRRIFEICGRESGYDVDKIKKAGLTLENGAAVSVPGLKEAPITLECKVIYQQTQDLSLLEPDIRKKFYGNEENPSGQLAVHTAYYGEIVNAYIAE